jgi:hypothetical protein
MSPRLRSRAPAVLLLCSTFFCSAGLSAQQKPTSALSTRSEIAQPAPQGRFLGKLKASVGGGPRIRDKLAAVQQLQVLDFTTVSAGTQAGPSFALHPTIQTARIPTVVEHGDFDRDGHQDLAVTSGYDDEIWIYRGSGNGSFARPYIVPLTHGVSPIAMKIVDIRKNGILDIVVANVDSNSLGVLLGNGDGTFSHEYMYSLPGSPSNIAVADFDSDGKLDLVTNLFEYDPYYFLKGDGTGKFGGPVFTGTNWNFGELVAFIPADINRDGKMDIVQAGIGDASILIGDGTGHFWLSPNFAPMLPDSYLYDLALGDFDEDGCDDVAATYRKGYARVFFGRCDGTFRDEFASIRTGDGGASIRAADLNGDDHLDLVAGGSFGGYASFEGNPAYSGNLMSVAFGDGNGSFSDASTYRGAMDQWSMTIADFNGDHALDVVTASQAYDVLVHFTNDGAGIFDSPSGLALSKFPLWGGMDFADVNGDARTDIVFFESYSTEYGFGVLLSSDTGFRGPQYYTTGSSRIGDFKLADFRHSGRPDFIAVADDYSNSTGKLMFAPNAGDGKYGSMVATSLQGAWGKIGIGDFNRDGSLDVVAAGSSSGDPRGTQQLGVFFGNGGGSFTAGPRAFFSTAAYVSYLYVADFNRDGVLDVLVNASLSVWQFIGKGDGTFQTRAIPVLSEPLTLADVNRDGCPDIIQYDSPNPVDGVFSNPKITIYTCQSDGSFAQQQTYTPYDGLAVEPQPMVQMGWPYGSITGDFNGDGNIDIAAFQRASAAYYDQAVYVQFLIGDGTGMFTPTFHLLDYLRSGPAPRYAIDLDGDGRSELVEVSDHRSSFDIVQSGAAPRLQLFTDPRPMGSTSIGYIVLNLPSQGASRIYLSSSDLSVAVPAYVDVPSGQVIKEFTFTLSSSATWRNVIELNAQMGTDTARAYVSRKPTTSVSLDVTPPPSPTFLKGSPSDIYTVQLSSLPGYSTTLDLACGGLPPGVTCKFDATKVSVPAGGKVSTQFRIVTSPTAPTWWVSQSMEVTASDSSYTLRQNAPISFLQFTAELSPISEVQPPASTATPFNINGVPPYTFTVTGLPAGASWSVDGDQVDPPATSQLTFHLNLAQQLDAGDYPFTARITSMGQTIDAVSSFRVIPPPGFELIFPVGSQRTVQAGDAISGWFSVRSLNHFAGSVGFSCVAPEGATCTVRPQSLQLSNYSEEGAYVDVQTSTGSAVGTYDVRVQGRASNSVNAASFPLTIAKFTSSPVAMTMKQHESGTQDVTISVEGTYQGQVMVGCQKNSAPISCVVEPQLVTIGSQKSFVSSVRITASTLSDKHSDPLRPQILLGSVLTFGILLTAVRRGRAGNTLVVCLIAAAFIVSCGGGGGGGISPPPPPQPRTYTVQLTVSIYPGGKAVTSGEFSLTINP